MKLHAHALILLGIFFVALSAYGSWYEMVGKKSAQATSLAEEVRVKAQTSSKADRTQLEQARADEAAIKGYFVDTVDIVPFLESLQKTGDQFGTKVSVESVSSEAARPRAVLVLAIRVTGTFDAVMRTLGTIEYAPHDIATQSVTLTASETAGQWEGIVTVRVGTAEITAVHN